MTHNRIMPITNKQNAGNSPMSSGAQNQRQNRRTLWFIMNNGFDEAREQRRRNDTERCCYNRSDRKNHRTGSGDRMTPKNQSKTKKTTNRNQDLFVDGWPHRSRSKRHCRNGDDNRIKSRNESEKKEPILYSRSWLGRKWWNLEAFAECVIRLQISTLGTI